MKPLRPLDAKKLIRELNRIDLNRADYGYIREVIAKLFVGMSIRGITPHKDTRLYRGIKYAEKPQEVHKLGYPPADTVVDFQRCNSPNSPMFYCSPDPAAVFYELAVKPGDRLYLSKWSIINDFWILQLAPNVDDTIEDHLQDIVLPYFETKFSQPIHETYSSQYKITAAIAERMSQGAVVNQANMKIGALSYPSVSHPSRSENLAIQPEIVDNNLRLDYVEEITIKAVRGTEIEYDHTDFSSTFNGGKIEWENQCIHWAVPPGTTIKMTVERDGWVARDEQGNTVNPGSGGCPRAAP